MPSRNTEKIYVTDNFYHVYNRGVDKQRIFNDDEDYTVLLNLLKRYLKKESVKDGKGREYENLHEEIELVAYCLMPNHYHFLFYLHDKTALTTLLRNAMTSYTVYYNKKHGRVGHLFQGRFKASMIDNEAYLSHISRYIHLNPVSYKTWPYTSLPYYIGTKKSSWVKPERILELFRDREEYAEFVDDYLANKQILDELKSELAN